MKKIHLLGIAVIAVAIGILISISGDVATYATFDQASEAGGIVKIAGTLEKSKEMIYDPAVDPNYFSFWIADASGKSNKVVLLRDKPQDFEMSEQVVLTGAMKGEEFVATDVLLKCPSKYKDEEIALRKKANS
ncbi:MAG: cytochrome c maturation protein CcmE [Saprospiraceae bacterium]|nr:cytochrome c maturation protein CcmE [Saprospiraceae bacterium]